MQEYILMHLHNRERAEFNTEVVVVVVLVDTNACPCICMLCTRSSVYARVYVCVYFTRATCMRVTFRTFRQTKRKQKLIALKYIEFYLFRIIFDLTLFFGRHFFSSQVKILLASNCEQIEFSFFGY